MTLILVTVKLSNTDIELTTAKDHREARLKNRLAPIQDLGEDARVMLPDESLQVTWQLDKPQLNERYQIHWEW